MAEIDQLISFAAWQSAGSFFPKIRDRAQVIDGFEKLIHALARNGEDVVEGFAFRVDKGEKRWHREVYPGDATIRSGYCPAGAAAVGVSEIGLVAARLANQIGFEFFQSLVLRGDVAVKSDGFGDEFFELDVGHNRMWFLSFSCRAGAGAFAPELALHEGSTPGFSRT
ncbi:MAG: hypothetical protein H0X40_10800 [Chthoniobacterales bacterium]|nr:hypothetical protein [Chthoniobacterales bacterium]